MIPPDITTKIGQHPWKMERKDRAEAKLLLQQLGIAETSAFAQFFLAYEGGFALGSGMKEMLDIAGPAHPSIPDATDFVCQAYGVPRTFLCLTSPEGEGFVLYEKKTERVYDTGLDELAALLSGDLRPRWQTFFDYLRDYFNESRKSTAPR